MVEIFHGSNQIVKNPKILVQGFYKDFGYGFYCARMEKQAMRWALTKKYALASIFLNNYINRRKTKWQDD